MTLGRAATGILNTIDTKNIPLNTRNRDRAYTIIITCASAIVWNVPPVMHVVRNAHSQSSCSFERVNIRR